MTNTTTPDGVGMAAPASDPVPADTDAPLTTGQLWSVAIHESAHSVICNASGGFARPVIRDDGSGFCHLINPHPHLEPLICLSGKVAELVLIELPGSGYTPIMASESRKELCAHFGLPYRDQDAFSDYCEIVADAVDAAILMGEVSDSDRTGMGDA